MKGTTLVGINAKAATLPQEAFDVWALREAARGSKMPQWTPWRRQRSGLRYRERESAATPTTL
jgi:hypothetical protein